MMRRVARLQAEQSKKTVCPSSADLLLCVSVLTNKVRLLALRTAAWCRNSVPCVHKRRTSRPPLLSLEWRPSAATRRDCHPEIVVPPHSPATKPVDGEVRPCSGGGA